MHRVVNHETQASALQAAAESRRNQSASAPASTSGTQQSTAGAQYDFAEIFGQASNEPSTVAPAVTTAKAATVLPSSERFSGAIATATATISEAAPSATLANLAATSAVTTSVPARTTAATTVTDADAATTAAATTTTPTTGTAATAAVATAPATTSLAGTGIQGLVSAIMNGTFKPTYVTDPSKLQEVNPLETVTMPNFYYASDQTASQLASILGGKVVQMTPFGQDKGWSEPVANFIQLPNGQTFNAADVAYYANTSNEGTGQLTADITATINQSAAWSNYYQFGGAMPTFPEGFVGPPISGMTYASNMIDASGNVINPAMLTSTTQGTL